MPTYNVTAPDGRSLKIEGDRPPTEAELNQIFTQAKRRIVPVGGVMPDAPPVVPVGGVMSDSRDVPIAELLKAAPVPQNVRADAWDAFYQSADQNELAKKLKALPLPQETKAALWDAKGPGSTSRAITPDFTGGVVGNSSLDNLSRFLGGAWKNLNPVTAAEGMYSAVRHPINTATAIGTAQLTEAQKALADLRAGRYSEMLGHGTAAALPIIGPAASAAGERIATGDVAGGLGEGVGLLAPFVAAPVYRGGKAMVGTAVNAVRSTETGTAALDALAAAADRAATNRIIDVGAPKVGPKKVALTNRLADVAPQLARAEDLSALSREGFATKISTKLEDARGALDDATDSRLASQQVRTGPILAKIDEQIGTLTAQPVQGSRPIPSVTQSGPAGRPLGQPVEPAPMAAQIETLRRIRSEVAQLGPIAPYEAIRRIRAAWDDVARSKWMSSTAEDAVKSKGTATGAEKGTGALRDALAAADPRTAAANADFSLYKTANDVVQAAIEAERARPRVLRGVLARTGGAMAGAEAGGVPGAAIGALLGAMVERADALAPTLKVVTARRLARIADLLRGGNQQAATTALRDVAASLPSTARAVTGRVATPLGNLVDVSALPRAADNQDSTVPTTSWR